MMLSVFRQQLVDAFNLSAQEGISAFSDYDPKGHAELSHICFKFQNQESYQGYVAAAHQLGNVVKQEFNGKQISWCRLAEPLRAGNLTLEWIEMVEPKTEKNAFNGVVSIGYCVPGLSDLLKLPSPSNDILFRYQPRHVHP